VVGRGTWKRGFGLVEAGHDANAGPRPLAWVVGWKLAGIRGVWWSRPVETRNEGVLPAGRPASICSSGLTRGGTAVPLWVTVASTAWVTSAPGRAGRPKRTVQDPVTGGPPEVSQRHVRAEGRPVPLELDGG